MGLDPEFDDYEGGVACPHCHEDLFDGKTPKYVELELAGLQRCPLSVNPAPNGVWLLPQVLPCEWYFECPPYRFHWILGDNVSFINVWEIPMRIYFYSQVLDWCLDSFKNETEPCGGASMAVGGTAKLRWGPTIGPQSSFIQWDVGDPCCICENLIFSGFTPRYVEAKVVNIGRCPISPDPRPNGLYLLTQISPCTWELTDVNFVMTWTLTGSTSTFYIRSIAGRKWFDRTNPSPCRPHFEGQKVAACLVPGVSGWGGTVDVTWGPWVVP